MKKLNKLTLSELSEFQLNDRKMSQILGGGYGDACQCGCNYEGQDGGSSTADNSKANTAGGLNSGSCPEPSNQDCGGSNGAPCFIEPERQDALCPHLHVKYIVNP